MKKGRPAHTLCVLVDRRPGRGRAGRRSSAHTSTIGLREQPLGKHALERDHGLGRGRRPAGRGQARAPRRRARQRAAGVRRRRPRRPPPSGRPVATCSPTRSPRSRRASWPRSTADGPRRHRPRRSPRSSSSSCPTRPSSRPSCCRRSSARCWSGSASGWRSLSRPRSRSALGTRRVAAAADVVRGRSPRAVPARRGDPVPRGAATPTPRRRRRARSTPSAPGRPKRGSRRSAPASWCCSRPSGATSPSC